MSDKQKEDLYMSLNPINALIIEAHRKLTQRNDRDFVLEQLTLLVAGVKAEQIKEDYSFFEFRYMEVAQEVDRLFRDMNQRKAELVRRFDSKQKEINE